MEYAVSPCLKEITYFLDAFAVRDGQDVDGGVGLELDSVALVEGAERVSWRECVFAGMTHAGYVPDLIGSVAVVGLANETQNGTPGYGNEVRSAGTRKGVPAGCRSGSF